MLAFDCMLMGACLIQPEAGGGEKELFIPPGINLDPDTRAFYLKAFTLLHLRQFANSQMTHTVGMFEHEGPRKILSSFIESVNNLVPVFSTQGTINDEVPHFKPINDAFEQLLETLDEPAIHKLAQDNLPTPLLNWLVEQQRLGDQSESKPSSEVSP